MQHWYWNYHTDTIKILHQPALILCMWWDYRHVAGQLVLSVFPIKQLRTSWGRKDSSSPPLTPPPPLPIQLTPTPSLQLQPPPHPSYSKPSPHTHRSHNTPVTHTGPHTHTHTHVTCTHTLTSVWWWGRSRLIRIGISWHLCDNWLVGHYKVINFMKKLSKIADTASGRSFPSCSQLNAIATCSL